MKNVAPWSIPGLLGVQAAFAGSTFGTLYVCVVVLVLFGVVASIHQRWIGTGKPRQVPRAIRWLGNAVLFTAIASLVSAWRFGDYAGESINPMAFAFDALAHTAVFSGLLLWVMNPSAGHPGMLLLGLLVALLCVAAGGASNTLAGQLAVALVVTTAFVFASNLILGQQLRSPGKHRQRETDFSAASNTAGRVGVLFSLFALSAVLMTTTAIAHVTEFFLPSVKASLHNSLTNSLEAVENQSMIGSSRYVRGSRLGSIRRHMLGDPAAIALRAYAQPTPGYLRGTVFDTYSDGRWSAVSNDRLPISRESDAIRPRDLLSSGPGLTRLEGRVGQNLKRFFLSPPDDERVTTIEIHNDPLKGTMIFTPLAMRWLEANSSAINVSHHGVILGGVNVSNPYVCGVARAPLSETLDPQRRGMLLQLPAGIQRPIRELADQLSNSSPTAFAKAKAIRLHFQNNFEYSLSKDPPRSGRDPILTFLNTKHPAHCEYFATATVLLLRGCGVPARYVTGYVTTEWSDEEDHWLARNRDAHAWVEAYDQFSGAWFPVESTPGRSYLSMLRTNSNDSLANEDAALSDTVRDANESIFSRFWSWIASMRATDPLIWIFRVGQIPLFCVVVLLLWISFRRGYVGQRSPADIKCAQMLHKLDRRLKKLSLIRQPHETLHQFAARIERDLTSQPTEASNRRSMFLSQAAHWYRDYAAARYRGQLPTPFSQVA